MRIEKQITIGQQPRTVAFGLLSFSYMEKALGKDISGIQSDLIRLSEGTAQLSEMIDLCAAIIYGGLNSAQTKNNKIFSFAECQEMIDEIDFEIFSKEILPSFVESLTVKSKKKDADLGEASKPQ